MVRNYELSKPTSNRVKPSVSLVGGISPKEIDEKSSIKWLTWTNDVANNVEMRDRVEIFQANKKITA